MRKLFIGIFVMVFAHRTMAQANSTAVNTDTTTIRNLAEAVITAYEQFKNRMDVPVAVGIVRGSDLNRYNATSILPAVNNISGVRMEERSPGSYRFGIRGSASNTPFGVRNVKVYYNDIPYTDPGGNTYLNSLGYYNIRSLEVIKEPGSSLYGAGTGGVLLINSFPESWKQGASVYYTGGSYGLQNVAGEVRIGDSAFQNTITYQHLSGNGYREQSALKKDIASWDARFKAGKSELSSHFLYTDLSYQTPGGLTQAQFDVDPRSARPPAGAIAGAVQNKTTVYQKTFLVGFTYKYQFNSHWQHITTLYGTTTQMVNPTIRNYSSVLQPHYGGRTILKFNTSVHALKLEALAGAEVQQGISAENTYDNNSGIPGNLYQQIEVNNNLAVGFAQMGFTLRNWSLTGGISLNTLRVDISNFYPTPYSLIEKNFYQAASRIALLNKLNNNVSLYASVSKGYSPPTTEQITPTGSHPNISLAPSVGWDYELGSRGYWANSRFYYDVDIFYFRLRNTIVQRRDSAGGDYYLNAGGTKQAGAELMLKYKLIQAPQSAISGLTVAASYTYSVFKYQDFVQLTSDYSGKMLPGIAPHILTGSIDVSSKYHFYLNANANYTDAIPLDDANVAYAGSYLLIDGRLGYRATFKKFGLDIFAGVNNLLNQVYSLGNDVNAAGGRYYNVAPGISYFAGLSLSFND